MFLFENVFYVIFFFKVWFYLLGYYKFGSIFKDCQVIDKVVNEEFCFIMEEWKEVESVI